MASLADERTALVRAEPGSLPRHDDFSVGRRAFSVLSIATAVGLLAGNIFRLCSTGKLFAWWAPLAVVGGMSAADFLSGIVHWAADTWGSESMPLLGRRLLHPFRVHHVNPDDFLRRRFVDTNGDVAFLVVPILVAARVLPLDGVVCSVAAVFLTSFCAIGLLTNQVHQWAHRPRPPRLVRILQDWRVILDRSAHRQHHAPPHATNYCIATGWCNRPLAAIGFFRRLERAVTFVTGLQPRADEATFRSKNEPALRPSGEHAGRHDA
ncbi:MAG: fatty acid desaturase family protein [Planctomycetales bacterium]